MPMTLARMILKDTLLVLAICRLCIAGAVEDHITAASSSGASGAVPSSVNLSEASSESNSSLFKRSRLRGSQVGTNQSTFSVKSVRGYQKMQHLNCYAGHGAGIELWSGLTSVSECAIKALKVGQHGDLYSCFVYFRKGGTCFVKPGCSAGALSRYCGMPGEECCEKGVEGEESYEFDTYVNFEPATCKAINEVCYSYGEGIDSPCCGDATCTGQNGRVTVCKDNSAPAVVRGYQLMQHLNCYAGHGATSELWSGSASRDECGMRTAQVGQHGDLYSCFVYFRKRGTCFVKSGCSAGALSRYCGMPGEECCEQGVQGQESYDFDTYVNFAR